jgi:membrane-bound lytic murein transglycosylase MltF
MEAPVFRSLVQALLLAAVAVASACSSSSAPSPDRSAASPASQAAPAPEQPPPGLLPSQDAEPLPPVPSPYDVLPPAVRAHLEEPFTGDADQMVARQLIRAGVVFNRTHYFIDKGVQRGMAYDSIKLFEDEINKRLKTGHLKVNVAVVPLQRDQLFAALRAGKVDMVVAALTVTPERQKQAAFSMPTRTNVAEVPVTAAGAPGIATPDDLSGREVFVRKSSSYRESLDSLNASLAKRGKAPVVIKDAPEALEDDDLLEMVNAGLVDVTIVDDFLVEFWQQVFKNLQMHRGAAVRDGGEIAVAVRKDNPRMLNAVNTWIKEYGPKTAFGNQIERRYLQETKYVRSAASDEERRKLLAMVELFRKYGERYSLDYLMMAAQGYQESQLNQHAKSHVGAIGVMQVMPATGKELAVGDITQLEPNIHAGVKYIRFMMDQYFKDEPMDQLNKGLMTFASYNAGPGRVRQLRREAEKRGLDPNVWFGNVERIASERIGRETVQYVSNIYKYYVAYRLVAERAQQRERARS